MRQLIILPPHDKWAPWTDQPDPDQPDLGSTFRHLAGHGYAFCRLDLSRWPWNPWRNAHSILAGIDPLRALRVLLFHRRAAAVLCFFESSAVVILLLRRLLGFRGRVIIYDIGVPGAWRLRNLLLKLVAPRADMILAFARGQFDGLRNAGAAPERLRDVLTLTYPAFFAAAPDQPDGDVLAIGDDVTRDYSTLLAASLGLGREVVIRSRMVQEDRTAFPGVRILAGSLDWRGYRDLLAGASVVVLPLRDTVSAGGVTTLLEAMASGKAVVVSRSAGLAGYTADGETCRVVPPGDAHALRHAIQDLLGDTALRQRLGSQARRFVEHHCAPAANAAMLAAVLDELTTR